MAANEQTIIDTAERLLAETGRVPTVEAVREAVGGGSFSTISPVLREWRQQHQTASAIAGEIPARVREALERTTAALWGAFRAEVEERLAHAREAAENRAGEAEAERDQALREVARLETTLGETVETAAIEREALAVALEEASATLAEARQDIATLAERTGQQEGRIEALGADLARIRAELDAERQARQVAEGSAAGLRAENARLQERAGYVDELRAQVKALQDRLTVPANQNQPETPAKASRTRKKGGQPET